jgi:FR47-like protein
MPEFVIQNQKPNEKLIPALEKLLPSSLPVLRRIQYACTHPRQTAYYVVSANLFSSQNEDKSLDEPWTAAYVDLFAGGETQVWAYSSLEAEVLLADGHVHDEEAISDFSTISPEKQNIAQEQFRKLLQFIHRDLMPAYLSHLSEVDGKINQTEAEGDEGKEERKIKVIAKHKAPAILLGSLHTGLMKLLLTNANDSYASANFGPGLKVHRYDILPYVKYIFPSEIFQTSDGQSNALPQGYYYGENGLLPEHVELVKSRTHIPRERETLLSMPSVIIYYNDSSSPSSPPPSSPVAWGFLSYDGSLATLHVELEHRGKGLAIALSKEVMRRGMATGFYGSLAANLSYTHADVAKNNAASRRVMEKLGGRGWRWSISWTVVEVLQ